MYEDAIGEVSEDNTACENTVRAKRRIGETDAGRLNFAEETYMEENKRIPTEEEKKRKEKEAERKRKESEARRFKERYLEYYDDIKTNIRDDW